MLTALTNNQSGTIANLRFYFDKYLGGDTDAACNAKVNAENQISVVLLVYFSFIAIPLLLYTFRYLDDNRLVSWYWSISKHQVFLTLAALSVALPVLYQITGLLAKARISENVHIAFLTLLSFLMTIPLWSVPELIIDNSRYFSQAKYLELFGIGYFFSEWGNTVFAWTDLPLIPFLYGILFKSFGEHRVVIQVVNSAIFSGTVMATYFLGKTLWNHNTGITGAVLLLGIPYLFTQSPLLMVDVATMFILTLAVLLSVLAIKKGGTAYLAAASFCILAALLSKYSSWLFLSVIPLLVMVVPHPQLAVKVKRLLYVAYGVALGIGFILLWNHEIFIQQINILLSYQWGALDRWQESAVSTFLFHVHPLITLAALVSVYWAIKKRDKKFLIVSWFLLLVVLLDIKRIRYLMVVFPMLALMGAYALAKIRNLHHQRFVPYAVVLSSYVTVLMMAHGFMQSTSASNIQSAGKDLNNLDAEHVEVVVLPQQQSIVNPQVIIPTLDFYTSKTIVYDQTALNQHQFNAVFRSKNSELITKSPVRFTWESHVPSYYSNESKNNHQTTALAVIYNNSQQLDTKTLQTKLQQYQLIKEHKKNSEVFKFKTMVNLYIPK